MTLAEKMSEGLVVLCVGVCVVFGVLILLWGLLELMRVFFYDIPNKKKAAPAVKQPAPAPLVQETAAAPVAAVQEEDDEELIAVIAAAVAAAMGTSAHGLKIKSVRRISNWNK